MEKLTKESGEAQVKAALSACIAQEIRAGREENQAVAMCHQMVRDKTGKALAPEGEQRPLEPI